MSNIPISAREPIEMRRELVLTSMETGNPYTCADVCKITGLAMIHVRAAMRYLCDGGAVKQNGFIKTPTYNGGHNKTALYQLTGKPVNTALAALKHKQQMAHYHSVEPPGKVVGSEIPGVRGGRLVRFGRDYKTGSGQTADAWRGPGSALNRID